MSTILKSALILGVSGFVIGYVSPIILAPDANQGPLLGIFITGPGGFLLGGLIGAIVEVLKRKSPRLSKLAPLVCNWALWMSAALALLVIVAGIVYIPKHEKKYSHIIRSATDLQDRDKSMTSLSIRSLSDAGILQLDSFKGLTSLDFYAGWGIEEAKLTDAGLKNISEMNLPKLEMLMLGYCKKITDYGMQYVARIKNLKYLSLAGSG
jgi:hypothetical protein